MFSGQRGDDVVGLVAFEFERRKIKGPHQILDQRNLRYQILGHGRTVGFVFRINLLAKGRPPGVKNHCQMIRCMLTDHLEQHIGEAINGVGGLPFGIGQMANGKISAIDIT